MAENINNYAGIVGSAAVTTVNSVPGTFIPTSAVDARNVGQMKVAPSTPNVVFRTSSNAGGAGDPNVVPVHFNTSNVESSFVSSAGGLTHQADGMSIMTTGQPAGGVNTDGINTGPQGGTLPVATSVKKTSFQITSVTVDSSASNDGGDDSADDLDESHTEDSSDVATDVSRHTSESRGGGSSHTATDDNFTRNDIFYNPAPPSSMNIAPVIPTSSQYGLAIVPEGMNPVSEPPPPVVAPISEPVNEKSDADKDIVHNRFKVVKIVSTEPFKKGRWMCMDYFDHTTTTTGTTTTLKDTTSQGTQQSVSQPQAHNNNIQQTIQSVPEKIPVNVANVQQGPNVSLTSSPPQGPHSVVNNSNILPDSQQQQTMIQQNQQSPHVIQQQLQNNLSEQDITINSSGLPNGNGAHYHVNQSHNVQGRPYEVAPAGSIPNQQQPSIAQQQTPMTNQQQSRPMTGQVWAGQDPIIQGQQQPQTLGQIGPQSSISQNTSVSHLPQTMQTSQMHQNPVQVTQPSHLPAQSLPHGAHAQMNAAATIANVPAPGATAPQQQTAQSLGHNMLQNKPTFMTAQHQQSQTPSPNQYQQQSNSQPQQQMMTANQQSVIGNQNSPGQVGQVSQSTQQQQPQNYQQGMMMQNMTGLQQQVHVQQMNPSGVSQHSVQMQQQPQQSGQTQGIYSTSGQMMGHTMQMNMPQPSQQMMQQPSVIQNQSIMQQPQIVGQQHHQQIMGMQPSQQPMVSQPQTNAPQQNIMSQPQMMSQMMQNPQMSGMVTQQPLVSQPGVIPQQQGIMPQQSNLPQQNLMQQIPQQGTYPSQNQPQTISNQATMQQQPLMQQYPQQQPNPVIQQQQMMQPQNQPNLMAQQMGQTIPQGQQQQISMQQQQQSSQPNQQQQQQQQQQAPQAQQQTAQVNIAPQQTMYQNPPQQMQVSQANAASNMQAVHNIMPSTPQTVQQIGTQIPTSVGIPLQTNNIENTITSSSIPSSEPSTQQQSMVQSQQGPPGVVPNASQAPSTATAVPMPTDIHLSNQNPPVTSQVPPASTTTTSVPTSAITSLSAAATVIIDGVNSLGDAGVGGGSGGNEEGESLKNKIGKLSPTYQVRDATNQKIPTANLLCIIIIIPDLYLGFELLLPHRRENNRINKYKKTSKRELKSKFKERSHLCVFRKSALMIVTSYTPNIKQSAPASAMSALAADTHGVHCQVPTASTLASPTRDVRSRAELLDQNTLIAYVYCFIKNFVGATGTNTVAIDNKIEQAMDLVKSHLMFAVREEVEVLKEKISELMERITQLEYENSILRANASQETLAQLQKSSQHPAPNVNESHQGFS
ncbi:Protein bunched, class 2/F/G isoform [Orchesella cincta]|uniref:Protein bunched, class 2/F/G isoform n=1 Tax=Orchesella cincta TaxID=48709 RepID=A0A1D2MW41_ORCCI|nr:Protein bunched, class 2/F/G isoform [Orchesella cincta]